MKKWNHYICQECGRTTVARHDNEGVTPFLIGCRAGMIKTDKVWAPGCDGTAQSVFFEYPQNDDQVADVIFFRPPAEEAIAFINQQPPMERIWLLEHYQKGGSLMREGP
jgi:hypothetical protein